MFRMLFIAAVVLTATVSVYGQSARASNSFAAILQMKQNAGSDTKSSVKDMSVVHTDVNGTKWHISDHGNRWTLLSQGKESDGDGDVSAIGSTVRWSNASVNHRRADIYTLQGQHVGTLSESTSEYDASDYRNAILVVVVRASTTIARQVLTVQ